MIGPEGVVNAIAAQLSAGLPAAIAAIRNRQNLDDDVLLSMPLILTTEPEVEAHQWSDFPVLWVIEQSTGAPIATDTGVWAISYTVDLVMFVADRDTAHTRDQARRLILAVRETLLRAPGLVGDQDTPISLDPSSWSERYGDPGARDTDVIQGMQIEARWNSEETLTTPPLGQVDQLEADVYQRPIGQPLLAPPDPFDAVVVLP